MKMSIKTLRSTSVNKSASSSAVAAMAIVVRSVSSGSPQTAYKQMLSKYVTGARPFFREFGVWEDIYAQFKIFAKTMSANEAVAAEFAALLKGIAPDVQADTTVTRDQLALLKDTRLFLEKGSEPALKRITANISKLGLADVNALFAGDSDDEEEVGGAGVKEQADVMRAIVKKLTKRSNDPVLTLNEIRQFKDSHLKLITEYAAARKVFVETYKKSLRAFVRSSGKTVVPVEAARKALAKVDADYIPKGFVGGIDDTGRLYTTEGKLIQGMLIGTVVMNPKYDPKADNTYVCSLLGAHTQRLRTVDFVRGNKEKKFDHVVEAGKKLAAARKKWGAALKSKDATEKLAATVTELIYQTQGRIGGEGNEASGEATYGLSTVLKKHLKVTATSIKFAYPGKKGTPQKHEITNTGDAVQKALFANVKAYYAAAPRPSSSVFAITPGGKHIPATKVNALIKSTGLPITAHAFRHIRGNAIAAEQISKCPLKKGTATQAQAEKWYKEAMKAVGEALHHQNAGKVVGTTAITSYISPKVSQDFFKSLGLRVPAWVPAKDE